MPAWKADDLGTGEPAAPGERRADIDGLRALAILLVCGFHMSLRLMPRGFIGVDMFFVLSGFLIGGLIYRQMDAGRFSFLDFYARRARRLFPPLILLLIGSLIIGWFTFTPEELSRLGLLTAACSLFIQNLVWLLEQSRHAQIPGSEHLWHLWSLALEEQFYLAFPLAVWLARRSIPMVLTAALMGSVAASLAIHGASGVTTYLSPLGRAWEPLVGALAAHYWTGRQGPAHRPATPAVASAASLLGLGLVLLSLAPGYGQGLRGYILGQAALPVLGTLLLLWAGPQGWFNRTILASRPAVWLGQISYSLYLWHSMLNFLSMQYLLPGPSWAKKLGCFGISIAIAALSTHLIERPLRRGGRRPGLTAAALTALLATVGIAGYACHLADGFPGRAAAADARAG